jgi:NADH-quinone oxidoreductase subunit F
VDAARTAARLGAEQVTLYYRRTRKEMPAQKAEIQAAEEEGVEIMELAAPARVIAANGEVGGLELSRMELRGFDRSGRKRPVAIAGSEFIVKVDTVLSAVSQTPVLDFLDPSALETRGATVQVDRGLRTTNPKVWAGGDAVTGPAMVIDAIRAGRDAARAIDASIRAAAGEEPWTMPDEEWIEVPVELDQETTEQPQAAMPKADRASRSRDFREVEAGYSLETAIAEARRCMRCDLTAEKAQLVQVAGEQTVSAGSGTGDAKGERR